MDNNLFNVEEMNRENKIRTIKRYFGNETFLDGLTDDELADLIIIMFNVTKRKVQNIWDVIRDNMEEVARERVEEKGISFEAAMEEVKTEMLNYNADDERDDD